MSPFWLHNWQSQLLGGSPVESLQSHMILTMSHWSSGLPVCFLPQGTQVQIPWGVLCENGILLLAMSRYIDFQPFLILAEHHLFKASSFNPNPESSIKKCVAVRLGNVYVWTPDRKMASLLFGMICVCMSHAQIFRAPSRMKWRNFACQFGALMSGISWIRKSARIIRISVFWDLFHICSIPLLTIPI